MNERKARILQWPHAGKCPVEVGERFELQSCVIEITRVRESLKAGADPLWIAEFTRHEEEKPQLLRFVPPTRQPSRSDDNLDLSATERARRESAYTSTSHAASPHEPETVGADWEDKNRGKRELERQAAYRERMDEERTLVEATKLAARVKQEVIARGAKGEDLTHLLADVYERLAGDQKEAA